MEKLQFRATLLHPRYWFTWLMFGFWWLLAQLPYRSQLWLGRGLGKLLYRAAVRRTAIARRNIELCFPELTGAQREQLVRDNITSTAIAFFETGMAWFWPTERLRKLVTVTGLEHLQELEGQGALLMAFHFTTLDIGGAFVNMNASIDAMYRPHKNPVYDYVQRRGRERHSQQTDVVTRDDVRGMVRKLKQGRVIWYAPDQDYGKGQSVFVPFFGVPAATVTATSKFVQLGKAKVIPFAQYRLADGSGYRVEILPPWENFPTGDEVADARRICEQAEIFIQRAPEQYLWSHRRFKTRPPGEPSVYP